MVITPGVKPGACPATRVTHEIQWGRDLHVDFVTFAIFAGEERICLRVTDDFSFGWVPVKFAVQSHSDVGEVADFEHAVVRPDVGDRLLARLDAFDEVGGVVLADFSTVDGFDGSFRQRFVLQVLYRLARNLASINKEPTFGAFEENAIVPLTRDNHFDFIGHVDFDFKVRGRVVLVLNQRMSIFVFDGQLEFDRRHFAGACINSTERPARDVDVVSAPIGQFSSRVFVPVSECIMTIAEERHATTVSLSHFRE